MTVYKAYVHGALRVISPVVLVNVHTGAPVVQFACVAVNTKVFAPGAAAVTVTPVVALKPGGVPVTNTPAGIYTEGVVLANHASFAVAAFLRSELTCASNPRALYAENCGMAIAARIPMIATTTKSSISVKPDSLLNFNLSIKFKLLSFCLF
jgi:hypothetical protein